MSTHSGKSVRIFLVEGSPTGIVTAEIVNWTGHALLAPRSDLSAVRARPELRRTGIYLLLGEVVTVSERRRVYIGESDDVGRRLEQHASSKDDDFFERFCVFTSKDANLTKSHARYLESRLTEIARSSGRSEVLNANNPPSGTLPESDIADMEFFISQIELILPVLGFDILKSTKIAPQVGMPSVDNYALPISSRSAHKGQGPIQLTLADRKTGVSATAIMNDSEYVAIQGSNARAEHQKSLEEHLHSYFELRASLIADGSLKAMAANPLLLEFTRDVVFNSPSAASAVILGRSDNGRRSWKVESTSEELAEFQNRLLRESAE